MIPDTLRNRAITTALQHMVLFSISNGNSGAFLDKTYNSAIDRCPMMSPEERVFWKQNCLLDLVAQHPIGAKGYATDNTCTCHRAA